jgi:hypothetical protein
VSKDRLPEEGLHGIASIIRRARALQDAPVTEMRPLENRVLANCRDFSTMLASFLLLKGVPARARCGFARYFEQGKYVDHWVCEYWHDGDGRWRMVDAQIDAHQKAIIRPDFDTLDVPDRAFWVGGKAWEACRNGEADPDRFGIMDMWGLWYVCGNLALDIASLNRVEMLPWDAGIIAKQVAVSGAEDALYPRMAALSLSATAGAADVRSFYESTPAVQVTDETLRTIAAADAGGIGTGINPLAR